MALHFSAVVDTPIAAVRLGIVSDSASLRRICFLDESTPLVAPETPLARRVTGQLSAYFRRSDSPFDLPLAPEGSPFQRRVWRAICAIGVGEVATYGEIARGLDSAARAVGNACGVNPLPIVVPCHRVVAKCGLGGFMGQGEGASLAIKRWLLRHEGVL